MNFRDFVNRTIADISEFDSKNLDYIKEVVRKAIDFYKLNSYEVVENNQRYLHIHSMVEENLLSKIVESSSSDLYDDIEIVYEGFVIREY